jgi:prolyl oligopeptidase
MAPITSWTPGNYPPTRRSDHVDIYKSAANGQVAVPDPHCWLETCTDEAEKWVTAQQLFARTYLDKNSDKQKLGDLLRSCMDYPRVNSAFPAIS